MTEDITDHDKRLMAMVIEKVTQLSVHHEWYMHSPTTLYLHTCSLLQISVVWGSDLLPYTGFPSKGVIQTSVIQTFTSNGTTILMVTILNGGTKA